MDLSDQPVAGHSGAKVRALCDSVATMITEAAVFALKRHRTGHPNPPMLDADGAVA